MWEAIHEALHIFLIDQYRWADVTDDDLPRKIPIVCMRSRIPGANASSSMSSLRNAGKENDADDVAALRDSEAG
jgi:hypothetical protein